jgi:hypothetical protein
MWELMTQLYHEFKDWAGIILPVLPAFLEWYDARKKEKSDPAPNGDRTVREHKNV